ncbi:methyltransferase [Streptomyces sp. NPDC056660]|uniref:methyltransferase n=1 Tax=Streptomyces sp. NPDC056660 TaxID=3345897 RepID=UPI00368C4AF4
MTVGSLTATRPLRCWAPRGVYSPQADTRLLRRALCRERITGETDVLDLGTGSGMLAMEAARLGGRVTAVDISWRAVVVTWINALLNGQHLRVLHGDLTAAVPGGRRFDLVIANPPYVPAPGSAPPRGFARAWDAGSDGRLRTSVAEGSRRANRERATAALPAVRARLTSVTVPTRAHPGCLVWHWLCHGVDGWGGRGGSASGWGRCAGGAAGVDGAGP